MAALTVADRLATVRERIEQLVAASGRPAGSVELLAVTKGMSAAVVAEAVAAGVRAIGENRVQEARDKIAALPPPAPELHLIGHLQRNKVPTAARIASCVQSVDSQELAGHLDRRAQAAGRYLDVFVQVNTSGEASKSGCDPHAAVELGVQVAGLSHLNLRGLMTIGPLVGGPRSTETAFARLRDLRDEMLATRAPGTERACELSMGMSGDMEIAIAQGSTMVRVGTAIFGPRPPRPVHLG